MRFRYTIQYIEGKQNDTPDCMSRKYGESDIPSLDDVIINHVGISAEDQAVTIPELAQEGAKDPQYMAVLGAVKTGFPDKEEECTQQLLPFFKIRGNIAIIAQDELEILAFHDSEGRTRLVVPKSLRGRVKAVLHTDHRQDLARFKVHAQQHGYWPRMSKDLKSYIEQCQFCQIHAPSHQ